MQTFLAQFFSSVVQSIEKNLNDSLKISSGLWSEQPPVTTINHRIYFDVDKEYYKTFSDRMRKSNISIENKVAIKKCPAQSKWTFTVERLGEDNIYLSKYKCTLVEPENEACKEIVSRDVVSRLNNDCKLPHKMKKNIRILSSLDPLKITYFITPNIQFLSIAILVIMNLKLIRMS